MHEVILVERSLPVTLFRSTQEDVQVLLTSVGVLYGLVRVKDDLVFWKWCGSATKGMRRVRVFVSVAVLFSSRLLSSCS